jgi:ATP-dependent helicase IRC3
MDESGQSTSEFYREYNLAEARRHKVAKSLFFHQEEAHQKLDKWYKSAPTEPRGGILVLPTGGGKTFTACYFICRNPLSDGFKVLWLAHTHHLLEQAFFSFCPGIPSPSDNGLVGLIAEPKAELRIRVVSGTIGHFPVHSIQPSDDVVVSSLQTVCNAVKNRHQQLDRFLDSAKGRLFVVFDEAHHSPAPSYRNLMLSLRERCPQMHLMGLTATPTHSKETKRGWLHKLFPQGIIYQIAPQTLMASGILARPVIEEAQTPFEANFDERDYEKWVGTNRDLPVSIINSLASNRERNEYIAACYVKQRERYGKTIIFADHWEQCVQLSEALTKRGVKADMIFSRVDANPGSVEARNRRTAAENAKVLQDFRDGKLDVLINIRMLTEGTDVPDVQTVFLTRQTTSQILMTQMVGRALRGSKVQGTDKAFIVSFIDNWKHLINWAAYDQLAPGLADETIPEYGKRPPIQLISIDLVRRLAKQMDSGINVNPAPYKAFLPIGWYRLEYYAQVEGTDDIEPVGQLVMVYEDEKPSFERFIEALKNEKLESFEEDSVRLADVKECVDKWHEKFFSDINARVGGGLVEDLFRVARHMGQNEKQIPKFFPFDVRDQHDLDAIAQDHLAQKLDDRSKAAALKGEYTRQDRYWRILYYIYPLFKSHYNACIDRILDADEHGNDPDVHRPSFINNPEVVPVVEPPEELKERVKSRDHFRCLCCGYGKQRPQLQVDHISPSYHGGNNHFDNLQTLCKVCNGPEVKGIEKISFRNNQTTLTTAPSRLPELKTPKEDSHAKESEWWEMFLRRTINLFFRCAAVDTVEIGGKGERFHHWRIRLFPGNNHEWLKPHLSALSQRIREARKKAGGQAAPDEITITN